MTITLAFGSGNGHFYHIEVLDLPFHRIQFVSCILRILLLASTLIKTNSPFYGLIFHTKWKYNEIKQIFHLFIYGLKKILGGN